MEWVFLVKGSTAEPYRVAFKAGEGKLTATCNCQAGIQQQACRHRIALLDGDIPALASDNAEDVKLLVAALEGTPLHSALARVTQAEQKMAEAKALLTAAKRALSRFLHAV